MPLSPADMEARVRAAVMFQGLDDPEGKAVATMATQVTIERGQPLVEEGSQSHELYLLTRGRVTIHMTMPDGQDSESLAVLREGETLGESFLLGRARRIATAVAKDDVEALKWDAVALLKRFETHPHTGYVVMRNLARVLHERLTATNMHLRNTLNRVVDIF